MVKFSEYPRFTVIIPTKDRADYLYHTLRTCSNQDYENLDVIVSDDGSSDHTEAVVREAARKDARIRYITPGCVGMRGNFEFALDHVKPGYLIALGGDDGILPYGVSNMWKALQETGTQLLTWRPLMFAYPSVRSGKGQLGIFKPSGLRVIRGQDYLERQASSLNYINDIETPMFYIKGVVSTELVDRVRSRTPDGRFYVCPTPDGFSGVVLAGEVERYAFSGIPFSIGGASPTSQGMAYLSKDEEGKKLSDWFYKTVSDVPMHRELGSQPYSPLISLMTADYLLTARDLPGWPGKFTAIDYKNLLVRGIQELADGLYAEDRINRELGILLKVAQHHGLGSFFVEKVKKTRRHKSRIPYVGSGITPSQVLIDCDLYGIHNIFDASYVSYYAQTIFENTKFSTLTSIVFNSIKYKFEQLKKGDPFPDIASWV